MYGVGGSRTYGVLCSDCLSIVTEYSVSVSVLDSFF
jgi:hypothetical protein